MNALPVDDSGNRGNPGQGDTVNVTCPCSIWGTNVTPEVIDVANDTNAVNLGVKFQASIPGTATRIRFYKASGNAGTYIGELWTASGQLLASATFTNETGSGWQEVDFSQPVAIDANTIYIASYFAPNGHYSDNNAYFYTTPPMGTNPTITTVNSPPLQAPRNTNGVYSYAGTPTFPTNTFKATNYWVDVIFQTATGPTPTPTPTTTPTPTPAPTIQVTVQTNLAGLTFTVDGISYNSTQTFSWGRGESHNIATISPQNGATGVRYVWSRWSDNRGISHAVAPTTNTTYTATFKTQYFLTMTHGTGGTVSPPSGWKNSGAAVSISATPTNNTQVSYTFAGWTGSGSGSYSGTNNLASITMNGPITENASFTQNPVQVTVQTNPAGLTFSVDGTSYTSAQAFSWQPGSSHTIATTSPQSGGTGVRYVWTNWSGGGAISHTVTPTTNKTYTATFQTQYYLTMNHGTGGTVAPASGWKNSGVVVSISATPA